MSQIQDGQHQLSPQEKRALLESLLRQRARREALATPLSSGQKVLWLLQRREPDSAAYNTAFTLRLRAPLDPAALRAALQALVERHEALRTTFTAEEGRPVAVVHAEAEACLTAVDAAGWSEAALAERVAADYRRPFDLEHGPLLRATLYDRGAGEQVLLLALHHIICDAWSLWILMHELGELHLALAAGARAELPRPEAQYRDHVAWQERLLAGPEGERLWQYWRRQLAGELPVLDLPTDHPRPPTQGMRGASHHFEIAGGLRQELLDLGKSCGATLFMSLLAVFQVVLHRYTGQEDLIVGSPAAGRGHPDVAATIGYFANALPLRASFAGDPEFREFLSQVRHTVLDALAHQEMPFPVLVERLQPRRDPSRWPVAEAMLVLQRPPPSEAFLALQAGEAAGSASWGGVAVEPYPLAQMEGQLDLTWEVIEGPHALACVLKYNPELFELETIRRLEGHLRTVIAAVCRDPGQRVSRLPLLPEAERDLVLRRWQGAEVAYPLDRCLHHWIEDQARRTPDRVAVLMDDAEARQLTHAELDRRANSLAHRLRALGIGPDTVVGVLAERSPEMVVALLGILKAGGAYLPLDPELPRQRLAFMLADAEARAVVAQPHLAGRLPGGPLPVLWPEAEEDAAAPGPAAPEAGVSPDNLAYVIYTSGSTGQPKGVENTHRGICNRLLWMQDEYRLEESDRVLQKTPFGFDVSVWEFFWPLMTGAPLVLARPGGHRDREYLVEAIRRHRITTLHFVPSMLQVFLGAEGVAECGPPLRRVLCSGEALPPATQQRFFELLEVELHNLYGPTEAAVDVTAWRCRRDGDPRTVPIGRPIANTRIYLLDRNLQPVPVGVPGELCIGGVGVARGYRNRAELTAERFIADPFEPGARLYRTGDLCRWLPDGSIEYLRRTDLQVKLRGFRIELGEVEAALAQHPTVREAVVRLDGEGAAARLLAWFVPRVGAVPAEAELRRFLVDRIPEHMVPAACLAVAAMPLSRNGKLDAASLPRPPLALPEPGAAAPARGTAEQRIAAIWREVLRLEQVDPAANFFDQGGHSLLLAEVQTRLARAFGRAPAIVEMFQRTTIRALAGFYLEGEEAPAAQEAPADRAAVTRAATDIAIIGLAGRFPGAPDVETLWRNLREGVEGIARFGEAELAAAGVDAAQRRDPAHVPAFGALADIEEFDAEFFGLTPREAELMDVQHRLLLECAWVALEDAGHDPTAEEGRRYGLFAGVGMNRYLLENLLPNRDLLGPADAYQVMLGNDKDFAPTRASYKLGLTGPSVSVQTACSTSLVAVHLACRSLAAGECDTALAGGCSVTLPQDTGYLYREGMILSPDGHCRTFDAAAAGTVGGNGVALVVLKRLEDALADGDRIHAVIKGSAVNNDGAEKAGYTAPGVAGQAAVIAGALAAAGVGPDSIGYVEAHGTGTPLGDPIEVAALTRAFRAGTARRGYCALGSVKTNLGHLDCAAGVTGLIKAALAVEHGAIPPSLHFREPNPALDLARTPFFVPSALLPWPAAAGPRRAGVSSFGIGGTNAHVVLEEPPARVPGGAGGGFQLLVLSAKDPAALDDAATRLAGQLRERPGSNLADIAFTLACGRRGFGHRRFLVCRSPEEAALALEGGGPAGREGPRRAEASAGAATPAIAFMFSGQGAQHAGMAAETYRAQPVFREQLDRCAALLRPRLGLDLRSLLFAGGGEAAQERLRQTGLAQPALFAVEYALARLWMSWGVRPEALIGHSLGEYVAACLAEVWTLEDALELVALRAGLMQRQPPGAMLAVPLPEAEVEALLRPELALAAVNGERLCVVSGPPEAVRALEAALAARGIACRALHTSHAFHSAAMRPVAEPLRAQLRRMEARPPRIPILSNLTGRPLEPEQAMSPEYWAAHLLGAVRFADGLDALLRDPARCLIEIGPGNALGGLALRHPRRSPGQAVVTSLPHPQDQGSDLAHLLEAAGRVWLAGGRLDWAAFHAGQDRRRIALPGYPFRKRRLWIDPPRPGQAAAAPARRAAIEDWFYAPSWQRVPPPAAAPVPGSHWLLLLDESGLGEELAARLHALGVEVTAAWAGPDFARREDGGFVLHPASREDHLALAEALRAAGRLPAVVVHLWNVSVAEAPPLPLPEARDRGFHSLVHLAQALSGQGQGPERPCHIAVVSTRLHDVAGEEGTDPGKALLLGPATVIPQEFQGLSCSSIDLELSPRHRRRQLDLLLADAAAPGGGVPLAYRGGHRWAQQFVPAPLPPRQPALRAGGVWMITGGTGGVGLALARWLARTVPEAKLALLSRSGAAEGGAAAGPGALAERLGAALGGPGGGWPSPSGAVRDMQAGLDRLCLCLAARCLEQSGVPLRPGCRYTVGEIRRRLRVLPRFERFLSALLRMLIEDGILEPAGDELVVAQALPADAVEQAGRALLGHFPELAPVKALLRHCAGQLGPALSGEVEAIGVLYPEGALDLRGAERALTTLLSARAACIPAFAASLRQALGGLPPGRELRILEVGGGGGELTLALMRCLEGVPVQYCFTDIGRSIIARAERQAAELGLGGMRFGVLDIARDPMAQGFEAGAFDLVVGLDVVHATPRIRETLGNLHRLLAPGGALCLLESVAPRRHLDLIWGFAEGWWCFEDGELRQDSPLLTLPQWEGALRQAGFDAVAAWPEAGPQRETAEFGLLVAQRQAGQPDAAATGAPAGELGALGAECLLLRADVADEAAMREAVERIRARFGRIDGVIHAAGIAGGGTIQMKTAAEAEGEFRAKVEGSLVLETVLAGTDLEAFVLCSSLTSVTGGFGQVAYSAASAFQDAFAGARAASGLAERVVSIDWDRWRGLGMAATLEARHRELTGEALEGGMEPAEAVEAFGRILAGEASPRVILCSRDFPALVRQSRGWQLGRIERQMSRLALHPRPRLETGYLAPEGEVERLVAAIWQEELGIEQVGREDDFFALGGDSLIAIKLASRLREALGAPLTARTLYEAPTIAALAEHAAALRWAAEGAGEVGAEAAAHEEGLL